MTGYMLFLGGSNVGVADPTRTSGQPASANQASSQYLLFPPEYAAEMVVDLEVLATPSQNRIVNWILQTDFVDDSSAGDPVSVASGFFGLRWDPQFTNSKAVVCAASSALDGSDLSGPESPLPSTTGEPQVRTFGWTTGRKYRLRMYQHSGFQWRFEITDLSTSTTTVVRDISVPGGLLLRGAILYTEAFTDCQVQSSVRWSNLQFTSFDETDLITPTTAVAQYQGYSEGGCTNGNQSAGGGGVVQATGVARTTAHGSTITITPSFPALQTATATGAALSWDPFTDYLRPGNAGPYVTAAQNGVTSSLAALGARTNLTLQVILWRPSDGQWPANAVQFVREWTKFTLDELRDDLVTWGFIGSRGALGYTWDQVTVHQVTSTRVTVQDVIDDGENGDAAYVAIIGDVDDQVTGQKPRLRMVWGVTGRPHPGAADGSWDIQWLAAALTSSGDTLTRHLAQRVGSARFLPTVIEPVKDLTVTGDDYFAASGGYRATGPSWLWGREYRFVSVHELLHTFYVPHMIDSVGGVGGFMSADRNYPGMLEPISAVLAYGGAMWTGRGMTASGLYPTVNPAASITRAERVGNMVWQFGGGFASSRHLIGIALKVEDPNPDGSDYNRARYHLGEFNGPTATWTVTVKDHRPWAVWKDLIFLHYDGLTIVPLSTTAKVLPG